MVRYRQPADRSTHDQLTKWASGFESAEWEEVTNSSTLTTRFSSNSATIRSASLWRSLSAAELRTETIRTISVWRALIDGHACG
jgi:hypothetical protein